MNLRYFAAAIATLFALGTMQAHASLVVNGGFDAYQGSLSGGYYQHVPNGTAVGGVGDVLEGWGVGFGPLDDEASSGVDLVRDNGPLVPAANGNQFLDLNGTPGPGNIYQTIATVAGQEYQLRFSIASTVASSAFYGVFDGDQNGPDIAFAAVGSPAASPLSWVTHQVNFVAQGASTTIGFGQFIPPDGNTGTYLDAVSVFAVPEPTTLIVWSSLGLGAFGLAYLRNRRSVA